MLTQKGNIVVNKKPASKAEDYEYLRKTGVEYIQKFSGDIWTDHNLHDPGITILELLCYALTDLAYRTSFPVADLLTDNNEKGPSKNDFFTARKILTSHPVTINDYRKLILDRIPGIRNAWLEPLDDVDYVPSIYYDKVKNISSLTPPPAGNEFELLRLKGRYSVKLEVEDFETVKKRHPHFLKTLAKFRNKDSTNTGSSANADEYKTCLTNYAKNLLLDSRNLCEDFEQIKVANEEWVAICADIELQPDANADDVFLEIHDLLYNYINPSIQFYSFKELLDKGKRTEDIFNGPAATRGFLDEDELNKHGNRDILYVSDVINLLMDKKRLPGILQIKSIHLSSYKKNDDGSFTILEDAQNYCLHLKDKQNAVFQFMQDAGKQDKKKIFNHIRFSKGLIYFSPRRKPEYAGYDFVDYPSLPDDFENDLPIPAGRYRKLSRYYSVQNDFPLTYYTGMDGIPNSESNLRKAQRLHSKAFLLFFDQLLADYLAQLDNLKNTFTWRGNVSSPVIQPLPLDQGMIRDLRKILASENDEDAAMSDADFFANTYKKYSNILETPAKQKKRRNKMLDHLLARFNELFVDYSVFKFQQNQEGDFFSEIATAETINDKIQFLKVYPVISGNRSHGFNYTKPVYAADNISGLQLRVQKMMGLVATRNKQLVTALNSIDYKTLLQKIAANQVPANNAEKLEITDNRFADFDRVFGFHVLEHILLRPLYNTSPAPLSKLLPVCGEGTTGIHDDCHEPDNHSMQLTVVAPGWLAISNNMDFRAFTENLIRLEAPAHTALKICWLDPAMMFLFEKTTEELFKHMTLIKEPGATISNQMIQDFNKSLEDVYTMMGVLKNLYLPSNLDECTTINYNATLDEMNVPLILDHSALGTDEENNWYVFKK